ncbi:uncharacterized [Tachysurus ichikawai]
MHEGKRGGTAVDSLSPGLQVCLASAVETERKLGCSNIIQLVVPEPRVTQAQSGAFDHVLVEHCSHYAGLLHLVMTLFTAAQKMTDSLSCWIQSFTVRK